MGPRINNFGDLLGPMLVERIVAERQLKEDPSRDSRMLVVGSILGLAAAGDVVWGAGVNGKSMRVGGAPNLDVRAVRGPVTRRVMEWLGCPAPEVYGDPALLWSKFWPRDHYTSAEPARDPVVVVPNMHDWSTLRRDPRAVDPRQHPHVVAARIARAELVVGSSLHGLVIAESFGIPAQPMASSTEPPLKYLDYYGGTGRSGFTAAETVAEAVARGGEPAPGYDAAALLEAFPADLWLTRTLAGTPPQ